MDIAQLTFHTSVLMTTACCVSLLSAHCKVFRSSHKKYVKSISASRSMCSSRVASEYIVRVYVCASTACVCVCVCVCTCTCVCMCMNYVCVWCVRMCIRMWMYVRTCVYTTCVGGYGVCAHWCMFMYVWVGAKPCMHMCIYMCVVQGAAEDNSPNVSL